MPKIRIAITGRGSVSCHYLSDLRNSEHAQVVTVRDVGEERARERAEQSGVPQVYTEAARCLPLRRTDGSYQPYIPVHGGTAEAKDGQ